MVEVEKEVRPRKEVEPKGSDHLSGQVKGRGCEGKVGAKIGGSPRKMRSEEREQVQEQDQ